jgi:hypothetical protein
MPRQKLYCYIDESGQDDASSVFAVVAVVSDREQEEFRKALMDIERAAGTVEHKWHKLHSPKRLRYLELAVERSVGRGEAFFGSYPKPLPYFFPMIEVVERAIKAKAAGAPYSARVIVDGIDRRKGAQLTTIIFVSMRCRTRFPKRCRGWVGLLLVPPPAAVRTNAAS